MNIKELLENDELMESIVEDLDDLSEDSEVTYEVWALGYTEDEDCTDTEYLLGEFDNSDEAIEFAENLTLYNISCAADEETGCEGIPEEVAYFSIEVETVVEVPEDEGTMNLGTVYSRELWLDGEDGSEEEVVELTTAEYEVLPDDNTLKVSRKLLKDYNKNDYVKIKFIDEPEAFILTYKIFSTVEYKDGDCPIAEEILATCIKMDVNEFFTEQDLIDTVSAIKKVCEYFAK